MIIMVIMMIIGIVVICNTPFESRLLCAKVQNPNESGAFLGDRLRPTQILS